MGSERLYGRTVIFHATVIESRAGDHMVGCIARIAALCRGLCAVGIVIHCDGGWSERESGYCEVESWTGWTIRNGAVVEMRSG